ncbi:hypothetical protein P6166_06965 [Stenotrophomonas sp. HITSZ_GD]|uniref:hypothetical protein n=1 Tax=Stenotrophomonas sp. HITSZ_GD TaxID=3037248 RepID=UPI00240E945E|nr:hypothetical protein [Stenotrophomonas sp. HITSZ_GD]MDG2525094.1 hypothetical protein [Stenotrophomonas sp. HITSZ_GD]
MRIFNDLLFHHGFVTNEALARQLAPGDGGVPTAPPQGATHPHPHPRAQVRARQARRVRVLTALSPFR